ncbi:MFS transporter [Sporomusa aerivorans]|uniref:MFS transporter n=1 Tax=Sporomusa aerivorans TaxID=204936 RepID=UPI00352A2033
MNYNTSLTKTDVTVTKKTNVRWIIVAILFFITVINYADRATMSIAGPVMAKALNFDSVAMGYLFSAFSWAYVACQIPGGWLLDRFGSKKVYVASIFFWSLFTMLQGFIGFFVGGVAVVILFSFRFLVGMSEAPSFPANSRIVAAWFPASERGTASAIFNSAQYAATVFFAPLMGWLVQNYGWEYVFWCMGSLGILYVFIWQKFIYNPNEHPMINEAEFQYISQGGALVNMDQGNKKEETTDRSKLDYVKDLLKNRMMLGIYIAQYCINAITYFFLTWFPVYLVQAKGMTILKAGFVAAIPAICGFIGGVLGGVISDYLLKKGYSLTFSRKAPIIIGLLLSMTMVFCNYVDVEWVVVSLMALSFFGKGLGALGWVVNSDTAPKQIVGLSGGILNTSGSLAGITTPIVIGYIIGTTGSFNGGLVYVVMHAFVAILSYLFIVGEIKRVELE